MMVGICFTQALQERPKRQAIHAGEVKREALAAGRINRRVKVGPLIGTPYHVRWTKALRTIAPSVPVDQTKACFIEGQDLQRSVGAPALAALFDLLGELFLKASCSSLSAFSSCRGRARFSASPCAASEALRHSLGERSALLSARGTDAPGLWWRARLSS